MVDSTVHEAVTDEHGPMRPCGVVRAELSFVVGDATEPQCSGPVVIAHICNDVGAWGRGFVRAVSRRWRAPEIEFQAWFARGARVGRLPLGQVQFVPVERALWVANVVGQHGLRRAGGVPPIDYDAVRKGLGAVAVFAAEQRASVHMPRIGAGLAGGDWSVIEGIVRETLVCAGIPVVVYDLP